MAIALLPSRLGSVGVVTVVGELCILKAKSLVNGVGIPLVGDGETGRGGVRDKDGSAKSSLEPQSKVMLINFLMDVILYDVHNDSGEPNFGLE
jgi:hypothetical protein